MKIRTLLAAGVAAAAAVASANAETVTAHYSSSYAMGVDVTDTPIQNGGITTVTFNWARVDSAGPGVDSILPANFIAYCCEIGQTVSGGTDYVYDVQTAAQHGFSATQETLLSRLWWSYQGSVNSPETSAAFQMAVWELSFDTGADLSAGTFTGNSPSNVVTLSQSWLDNVKSPSYAGGLVPINVLHNAGAQDQLVPTPGSLALLGMSGLVSRRRRR